MAFAARDIRFHPKERNCQGEICLMSTIEKTISHMPGESVELFEFQGVKLEVMTERLDDFNSLSIIAKVLAMELVKVVFLLVIPKISTAGREIIASTNDIK